MRIITDSDLEVFTDPDGDTLTLLKYVRREDKVAVDAIEQEERLEYLRSLGPEMLEAAAASNASAVVQDDTDDRSDRVKREQFRRVVKAMTVGGQDVPQNNILGTYDKMPSDSVAWVDSCVRTVWAASTVTEAQAKKPVASA